MSRYKVCSDTERLLLTMTVAVLDHPCKERVADILAKPDRASLEDAVHHLTHLLVSSLEPEQRSSFRADVGERLAGLS